MFTAKRVPGSSKVVDYPRLGVRLLRGELFTLIRSNESNSEIHTHISLLTVALLLLQCIDFAFRTTTAGFLLLSNATRCIWLKQMKYAEEIWNARRQRSAPSRVFWLSVGHCVLINWMDAIWFVQKINDKFQIVPIYSLVLSCGSGRCFPSKGGGGK